MTGRTLAALLLLALLRPEAAGAGGSARAPPQQFLPLPSIAAAPLPAPLPPPTSSGVATAPPGGISPILLQPWGPAYAPAQPAAPAYPPVALPGPIDQQKLGSYRSWLENQERMIERGGTSPDSLLAREIRQQLLQLDQNRGGP
jgi:hypothetical protein